MAMPETAMNKNRRAISHQDYVGAARKISAVKPEPKARSMQQPAHSQLRAGILRTDAAHIESSLVGGQPIGHHVPPRDSEQRSHPLKYTNLPQDPLEPEEMRQKAP